MKDEEFQKLLNAPGPIFIPMSKKIYAKQSGCWFLAALLFLLVNLWGAIVCFLVGLNGLRRSRALGSGEGLIIEHDFFSEKIMQANIKRYWKDVSSFKAGYGNVFFNDNSRLNSALNKITMGTNDSIHNTYAIKTKQLAQLLNHWRERALANSKD